jgi:tetratricopeptide (TPR) repeat protein
MPARRYHLEIVCAALAALALPLLATSTARAQAAQQRQCLAMGGPGQLEACSSLIAAGRGSVAEYYYARGSALLDKRDCDGALADFDAAVRLKPNEAAYHGGRGLVFYSCKRDFGQALAAFSQVVRLTPNDAAAWDIRSNCKKLLGDLDGAIADDTMAIRLDPKTAMYRGNRAIAYQEKGDRINALADFNFEVQMSPASAPAIGNRGLFFLKIGETDLAIADFSTAVTLAPNYSKPYANRAEAFRMKGDLDRSLNDLDQAVRIDPRDPLNYARRADTLRYRGDFQQAIDADDRALALAPDYIPAFTGRGLSFERLGDVARARVEFDKAIASQSYLANLDYSKSALETARARLAALNSGAPPPPIRPAPRKAENQTAIPTPAAVAASVPADLAQVTAASQGRRIALVIGNSDYRNVIKLINPKKDAELVAASLRNVGFAAVTSLTEAPRATLLEALQAFAEDAKTADWAVVYYAGHGVEVNGVNYLIPIDARITSGSDISVQGVPASQIIAAEVGAKKLKLVVLDACRDNPFPLSAATPPPNVIASAAPAASSDAARSLARSLAQGKGLAAIKVEAGTLIVFAAKDGQTALDGDGEHSPFAVAVAQRLATPGVEINKLFRLVRDDVMEATAGRQEPYTYGSLPGREDFFFVAAK